MQIKKRNGKLEEFDVNKIINAVDRAFKSCGYKEIPKVCTKIINLNVRQAVEDEIDLSVEEIQDWVEKTLMGFDIKVAHEGLVGHDDTTETYHYEYKDVAKAFILYREKHKEDRMLQEKIDYMNHYAESSGSAADASNTDANSNVTVKNVANLEGEVWKDKNRRIQRRRMKAKLKEMFPEVADQYEKDIESHIIYVNDEASSPEVKPYCMAATLYPMMIEGTGNIDGVTPSAPNDINSFSGQVTNLVFLLSSQVKGAVALGDYFIAFNYYVNQEFGDQWYLKTDAIITTDYSLKKRTIKDAIRKGFKQFIYGVNQPAGNRSYNSPFSNVSFYDKTYFESMFGEFYYPDSTQPKWEAVDTLQRIFMELHRELRLIKPLTFPVTTLAMVHDNHDIIDKDYKELCAEEWAKGGSFFAYMNDSPTSLASCCRVLNEIQDNTFSSTIGLTGIMTGSVNVITLNLNRIVQNWAKEYHVNTKEYWINHKDFLSDFVPYFVEILERVYKYHIAYKTMVYDLEAKGMYSCCNAGYIYIKKLYSTIGLLGYTEAAEFLGFKVNNNKEYKDFIAFIFGIVKEQNKIHSIRDKKRPFLFNSEAVPGENMAVKFYEWDKKDGYYVPSDQNLYSSYFFKQWDGSISILDKIKLHGSYVNKSTDGGQACHLHLQEHLSKEQYLQLIDVAIKEGCNYWTYNIPVTECLDCHHIVNAPVGKCPKCGSNHLDYWIRVIGFLRPLSAYSDARLKEAKKRILTDSKGYNEHTLNDTNT